uniref:1-aminocyclopropane-1-carboxylate oxidase 10 n=1 Tax=Anthurium amnicola TaxID=1678845 RepID=A0A1D1ZJI9_9ARAE
MEREAEGNRKGEPLERQYMKGVRHLCDSGVTSVPAKYVLPISDRPNAKGRHSTPSDLNLELPIIDLADLYSPNRGRVLGSLAKACEEHGFFQVVNHGVPIEVIRDVIDATRRFFELPFEERAGYMSSDVFAPVRYGTSFNQNNDGVFCWRDFLKLSCHPLPRVLPHWPCTPADLRQRAMAYAKETRGLFLALMEAVLETLGVDKKPVMEELADGTQMMVVNYFPACPEPDLTLGMPPHSDFGFLTLLLQDGVEGLQIQQRGEWVTVDIAAGALVVNVGDHLEVPPHLH